MVRVLLQKLTFGHLNILPVLHSNDPSVSNTSLYTPCFARSSYQIVGLAVHEEQSLEDNGNSKENRMHG